MKNEVIIPKSNIQEIVVPIEGVSPLIVHKFSSKIQKEIKDKQNKKARKKEARDPEAEYLDTLYFMNGDDRTGFPATGFKKATVRAGKFLDYRMTDLNSAIFIEPDEGELVEIHGKHEMRTDMVRLQGKTADIRYRGHYPTWSANLKVKYNSNLLSAESVVQLIHEAGFGVGIGDWRPEKSGVCGRWKVKTSQG